MRVRFLGTGDAFSGGGRGNASLLLEDGPAFRLLVDVGPTAPQALRRLGIYPSQVSEVLITHLHGDHVAGLAFLELSGRYEEPSRPPLRVVGPPGTARTLDALYGLLYPDVADRPRPFRLEVTEVRPGERIGREGYEVETFAARHMREGQTALMLRISRGGRVLALTGDTGPAAPIDALARGADLLVAECTLPRPADGRPPSPTATHMSVTDIERLRPSWETPRVALTHLSAPARAEASALASPGVFVADDGAETDL